MRVNWPKYSAPTVWQIFYSLMAIIFGYSLYLYSSSIYLSILLGILILILGLYFPSHIRSVKFTKHLSKYGEAISRDRFMNRDYALLGIEYDAVLGAVPFDGYSIACTSWVIEEGVVIECNRTNRLIPWSEIKSLKHLNVLNQPAIELSIHDLKIENRLMIPWDTKLSERIPENIQQYYS